MRQKNMNAEEDSFLMIEAYQPLFFKLHDVLYKEEKQYYPPRKRIDFWNVVLPGIYRGNKAQGLLDTYLIELEKELRKEISEHSLFYWLHVYRRIRPGSVGPQRDRATNLFMRAIFEAAIQKYAKPGNAWELAKFSEANEKRLLGGTLYDESIPIEMRKFIKIQVKESQSLELLEFDIENLRQVYRVESLSYEVWRTVAMRRIIGKGSSMCVSQNKKDIVFDIRSDAIDRSVKIFDLRGTKMKFAVSAKGAVFGERISEKASKDKGIILMPQYNTEGLKGTDINEMFAPFKIKVADDWPPNFIWAQFNLKSFYQQHAFLSDGFRYKYGITLEAIIAVIGALLLRVIAIWCSDTKSVVRYWQRAYELVTKKFLSEEIKNTLGTAIGMMGLEISESEVDIEAAIGFLSIHDEKRKGINIVTHGPHYVLLPINEEQYILDYAWIWQQLYHLFFGIRATDENFKARAFEEMMQGKISPLSNKELKADDTSRQIDASREFGETLIIMECRVKEESFAFFKGDMESIRQRIEFAKRILFDIDEKAFWLASRPLGKNYDIRRFKKILPIGITPFVEYIPCEESHLWLGEDIPRVLTPSEFNEKFNDGTIERLAKSSENIVKINPAV
jgi:hypothetical protein